MIYALYTFNVPTFLGIMTIILSQEDHISCIFLVSVSTWIYWNSSSFFHKYLQYNYPFGSGDLGTKSLWCCTEQCDCTPFVSSNKSPYYLRVASSSCCFYCQTCFPFLVEKIHITIIYGSLYSLVERITKIFKCTRTFQCCFTWLSCSICNGKVIRIV